MKTGSCFLQQ